MATQLELNRKRAVEMLLKEADKENPTSFDYLFDDQIRELYDLPPRPPGQEPYVGWMVGDKEAEQSQLRISAQGINFIKRWEGCRLTAYLCPANIPTIGWGHTKGVKLGMKITQIEADTLFLEELKHYDQAVSNSVKVSLSQNQFDVLVSFCYNVGVGAFKDSTLLRVLNQHNYAEAANQLLRWDKAGKKVIPGLTYRREAEKELFES